jgi:hypothetical protein
MTAPKVISKSKSAVSTDTKFKSVVAADKQSALLAKNTTTVANLKKTNIALKQSLDKPISKYDPLSLNQELKINKLADTYLKTIIANGVWGPNQNQNTQYGSAAGTTGTNTPGATLSAGDRVKLETYEATVAGIVSQATAKIKTITDKIAKNKAIIDKTPTTSNPYPSGSKANTTPQPQKAKPAPEFPTSDYLWNLPPHAWSLPVEPDLIAPDTVPHKEENFHVNRRGRIWYYNGYVGPVNQLDYEGTGVYKADPATGAALPGSTSINKYGFQFVWNPETFSQNTQVNMSVTPSNTDPTVALTGFAAANSTMSFTIRLDRTNDFACAKSFKRNDLSTTIVLPNTNSQNGYNPAIEQMNAANAVIAGNLTKYYTVGNPVTADANLADKIAELMTYGTEADIEYLYKTVNGSGWKGIGGRDTSNIGYLMPALIRLDLGNQKFVGVVASIGVNHLAFTRDLVPIRTDVSITVDLRANIQPLTNAGGVGQ